MAGKKTLRKEITPGELYKEIAVSREEFEGGGGKLVKREQAPFVRLCRSVHRQFPSLGTGAKFKEEYKQAIEFLGWDLKPEEFAATAKFVLLAAVGIGVIVSIAVWLSPLRNVIAAFAGGPQLVIVYTMLPFIIIALALVNYVQNYPMAAARTEQTRAMTYVPEIVGYMIMSMKLVPNLEKAVEFSAEHGSGKIAEDFKRIIWDTQIGVYTTLSEALDELAYRWGKFSEEFKHALMMIRASVLENTEAKRYQLLDKTMATILASIREKMEKYARALSEPSVLLFYLGVLLPLILIIVLPVGSAFSGTAMASTWVLVLIYNIVIPITTFVFARSVLMGKPPTTEAAVIPDDYPGLPPKHKVRAGNSLIDLRLVIGAVIVMGIIGSVVLSVEGIPPKSMLQVGATQLLPADKTIESVMKEANKPADYFEDGGPFERSLIARYGEEKGRERFIAERTKFFSNPKNDVTPYNLIFGLVLTVSLCFFAYLYFTNIYKRKAQLVIEKMESEFKDSLYILASRLGENKPVEEALKHTRDFLPGFEISKRVFSRTVENIELLGMPLEAAVFDRNYGSLRSLPSRTIRTGMRILVDSVKLGVNVAARTIISLSLQLGNSEKVNKELKAMIADTTNMMRTMSIFIAPVVLGITTALQKVVMLTLSSIQTSSMTSTISEISSIPGGAAFGGAAEGMQVFSIDASTQAAMVTPLQFLIIVATYVLQLVFIMVYFSSKIEEDNDVLFRLNLAKALPIATTVFLVSVVASSLIVGNFMG
jgi:hypothetical protein